MRLSIYLFLIIVFQSSFNLQAQKANNSNDSIDIYELINELLIDGYQNKMFPGVSIALFKNDTTQYLNYGYAKTESQVAVSRKTWFQLGSVGKLLTAIAVLQQVDGGKLDLHANISEYIGDLGLEFNFQDNPITLHCLLTHSCGFNDVNIGYMAKDAEHILSLEEFVKQYNPGLFQAPETDIV